MPQSPQHCFELIVLLVLFIILRASQYLSRKALCTYLDPSLSTASCPFLEISSQRRWRAAWEPPSHLAQPLLSLPATLFSGVSWSFNTTPQKSMIHKFSFYDFLITINRLSCIETKNNGIIEKHCTRTYKTLYASFHVYILLTNLK